MYALSFVILAVIALLAIILVTGFWMLRQHQLHKRMLTLQMEVRQLGKEAHSASKVKEVFLHNMSHQIRTPLHAINGFAQLLAAPDYNFSDEDRAEFAAHIKSNTTILNLLFDDMLSVVDIECGKFDVNITKVKVNEVVRETMHTLEHMVSENVELIYEPFLTDEFTMDTDAHRLQQVLMNFLSNAMKHTERGFIKVGVQLTGGGKCVEFSVTDSGEGVPKEMAKAIFTRFKKLDDFTTGNGLGLSLCKTIAERLHGRCYLDTEYSNGARFVFAAPIVQPAA